MSSLKIHSYGTTSSSANINSNNIDLNDIEQILNEIESSKQIATQQQQQQQQQQRANETNKIEKIFVKNENKKLVYSKNKNKFKLTIKFTFTFLIFIHIDRIGLV